MADAKNNDIEKQGGDRMTNMNQPSVLDGTQRNQGATAQEMNIYVARIMSGIVRTTLGPKGMDKLLVDSLGDATVTNDGVTILREMNIDNPIAKMMVEIARTQETEVGDGTTTAVVMAGELLKNAETLIKKRVHPTVIAKGYKLASEEAIKILEEISINIKESGQKMLMDIAKTAMTGKGSEENRNLLAEIVVESILSVRDDDKVNLRDIRIEKKTGGSITDTKIIEGIILNKEKRHPNMPKKIEDVKIALLDGGLEIKNLDMDAKINISNPVEMQAFIRQEAETIKAMIEKIKASGANTVICGRSIDDAATHYLVKMGVYGIQRVSREDLESLSKATGARIVTNIDELEQGDIGAAGIIEEEVLGRTMMTIVKEIPNARSVTILVRGATEQMVSETKRAIEDALGDVATVVRDGKIVGGAGAPEIIVAKRIREFSNTLKGREQLAVLAFADSMESIPEALAENAGLDPIDMLTEMRSSAKHGNEWPGLDVFEGKVMNSFANGIVEPLRIKTQAINSATEVAMMVLRIDDVISILKNPNAPPDAVRQQ